MKTNILRIVIVATAIVIVAPTESDARRGGLVCGAVQMSYYGIRDPQFRLAKNWARLLPHTTASPGAVVVQRRNGRDSAGNQGYHVSRIIAMRGNCTATVADEKGQYERDICKALIAYVNPTDANGNRVAKTERTQRQFSAKRRHTRTAAVPAFVPADRLIPN